MLELKERTLIYAIGDEDCITGLLLAGIGNRGSADSENFFTVTQKTQPSTIEEVFRSFLQKKDNSILLITQKVANMIRHAVDAHKDIFPVIIELPSKESPYNPANDSVMKRARALSNIDE